MPDLWNISSELNRDIFSKQIKERLSKCLTDLEWNQESIMVLFIQSGETQDTLSISSQSVIGKQRFGQRSKSLQSCRQDIIQPTLPTVAGPHQDAASSSCQELMVSSTSGISTTSKTKLLSARRSLTHHLPQSQRTLTWSLLEMPRVLYT